MSLPGPDPAVWNRLAEAAGNIFATHTWNACWWAEYGDGGTPHVLVDDERDPRVVLPLYVSGRGLRQVRYLGHGPADQLGPVCAPADAPTAVRLLREALTSRTLKADVVLLQDMAVDKRWWEPLGGQRISTEVCPVVRFAEGETWESFLATRSKNLRSQMSKKPRRAETRYAVTYRLATDETLDADIATLFTLHAQRWNDVSPLLADQQRRFTTAFAKAAHEQGWLRLWVMELDGQAVAAALTFHFADAEYCYQFGRDPAFDSDSVGFVLLVHVLREALASGATEFRFLRGDEDYKFRFATGSDDIETIAIPRGVRGRAATRVAAARRARQSVAAETSAAGTSAADAGEKV